MTDEKKFFMGVIVATIVIIVGAVILFSQPPKPINQALLVPVDAWATGSAQPKATLVEFSDYECPSCISIYPLVKQIVEKNTDKLRFVYRHFPLPQHLQADYAAQVSEAAGAQGKFWEMHDQLFKLQGNLTKDQIASVAALLQLDILKFNQDLDQKKFESKIQKDITDGNALGINATPTFYLNGQKLNLLSLSDLEKEVLKALGN